MPIGYKLFRTMKTRPNEIFPLYVNATQSIPFGEWISASEGERKSNGKVKSRLGDLAYRPGWHINDICPYVTHIGEKDETGKIAYMREDLVWAEVEYHNGVNYQNVAKDRGMKANGKFDAKLAQLDYIPVNGFYKYKTNPNMFGEWIIAGEMKVNRLLSDDEVRELCALYGLTPLEKRVDKVTVELMQYAT